MRKTRTSTQRATLRDLLVTLEQSVSPQRNLSGTQRAIIRGTIRQQKSVVRT